MLRGGDGAASDAGSIGRPLWAFLLGAPHLDVQEAICSRKERLQKQQAKAVCQGAHGGDPERRLTARGGVLASPAL
jgi:hypothetical protein